jgi:hypothetical protein
LVAITFVLFVFSLVKNDGILVLLTNIAVFAIVDDIPGRRVPVDVVEFEVVVLAFALVEYELRKIELSFNDELITVAVLVPADTVIEVHFIDGSLMLYKVNSLSAQIMLFVIFEVCKVRIVIDLVFLDETTGSLDDFLDLVRLMCR